MPVAELLAQRLRYQKLIQPDLTSAADVEQAFNNQRAELSVV